MKKPIFNRLRLRNQLIIILAIAIGANLLIQAIYFVWLNSYIQDKAIRTAASTMDQMEQSIETRITGILNIGQRLSYNRYTQSFLTGISEPELMDTYRIVEGLATDLVSVNNDIASIALTSDYLSFTQVYQSLPLAVQREVLRYPLDSENIFFTGTLQNTVDGSQVFAVVVPSYSIYDTTPDFSHRLGSVLLFCHAQEIVKTLKLGTATSGTEVFAIDDNGLVISSTSYVENSRTSFEVLSSLSFDENGFARCHSDGEEYFVTRRYLKGIGWSLYCSTPKSELMSDLYPMTTILLVIIVAFLAMILPLGALMIKSITTPFQQIIVNIQEAKKQGVKARIKLDYPNEIGDIANHIDFMMDSVESMTRDMFNMQSQLYEIELSKRQVELDALRSQINPHFLYNTLECIKSMGLVYDSPEIVRMSTSLSRLLRYSIKASGFVTAKEELNAVGDYISIMQTRFSGRFTVLCEISPEVLSCSVPKMILQPLVENAFVHGLEGKAKDGRLLIQAQKEGEWVRFTIEDNGEGMDAPTLARVRSMIDGKGPHDPAHLGLSNTIARLHLHYGKSHVFRVENLPEGGLRITIILTDDIKKVLQA